MASQGQAVESPGGGALAGGDPRSATLPPQPRAPPGEDGEPAAAGYVASLASIREAHARIREHVHRTPVMTCSTLSRWAGKSLFFKVEALQRSGSFKVRGASNAVFSLDADAAARGVVTHSSGNHGQALALAAQMRGIPAHIVMPSTAPRVKREAVEGYGAHVHDCEPTGTARAAGAEAVQASTGATFIHPSEDPRVISGQGTIALELLEQLVELGPPRAGDGPVVDAVVVPVGGGGMISGIALAVHAIDPRIRVFGAEPRAADDAARSKAAGRLLGHDRPPATVADGLRTTLGPNTWPVVRDLVERIFCVDEAAIIAGMRHVWERMKLCIEPSAGVGVAAALSEEFAAATAGLERVAVVLCGGNVDLAALPFAAAP